MPRDGHKTLRGVAETPSSLAAKEIRVVATECSVAAISSVGSDRGTCSRIWHLNSKWTA